MPSDDLSQWFQSSDNNEFAQGIEIPVAELEQKEEKKYAEIISREELLQMKETENLFSNELWKLSFQEMLQAIVKPVMRKSTISNFLQELYKILSRSMNIDLSILNEKDLCSTFQPLHSLQDVKNYFKHHLNEEYQYGDVNIIGSYLLKANLNQPETTIDIGVELSKDLLESWIESKDASEASTLQGYYKMRYASLIILYQALSASLGNSAEISWKLFRELDEMKPIISVDVDVERYADKKEEATSYGNSKLIINLYPIIPEDMYEELSNILSEFHESVFDKPTRDQSNLLHGIWEDMNAIKHLTTFHNLFQSSPTIVQSLCLLKVWSRLRGLLYKCDGVNGYTWTLILAHLAQRSVIENTMSPYQIFKITLKWISSLKQDIPIVFGEPESADDQSLPYVLSMYERGDFLILKFDKESIFNALHRITEISWKELTYEALLTLQYLNEEGEQRIENVQSTFTTPHNHFRKYDAHVTISNVTLEDECDSLYSIPRLNLHRRLGEVLLHGIGNRSNSIRIIGDSSKFLSATNKIVVGVVLSDEEQDTFVRGPRRTGHDVVGLEKIFIDRFLSVWGDRAKLMDSVLDEYMVYGIDWKDQPEADVKDKNSIHIIPQILNFLLHRNFTEHSNCKLSGEFLYDYYFIPRRIQSELKHSYDDALLQLHETLETIDVNLELQHVVGISSEFRGCALSPVILNAHALGEDELEDFEEEKIISYGTNITPIRVILDFHERSKWPLTPDACHKLKTFIYATYHEGLQRNEIHSRLYDTHLDIFISGLVLRAQIRLQQEITRYKTSGHIMNPYVVGLDRDIVMLPVHAAYIENFIRHFPQFTHVCRLAKKWTNAHLLGLDIPEPLIELLVAYSCYTSEPYRPSKSNLLCFYNFLNLLAFFPWQHSPLFVNLQLDPDTGKPYLTEKDQESINQIRSEFEVTPMKSPMYVVASYAYEERNFWTKFDLPSAVVLRRMIGKSKLSLKLFDALREDDLLEGVEDSDWKMLFCTSFQAFDSQINIEHLNDVPQGLYFEPECIEKVEKCNLLEIENVSVNSYPALDFTRRLRQQFSNHSGYFADPTNPTRIGVAFNPDYIGDKPIPFELNKLSFMKPNEKEDGLELNIPGLFEAIEAMSQYNSKKATIDYKYANKSSQKTPKKSSDHNNIESAKKRKREPENANRKKRRT